MDPIIVSQPHQILTISNYRPGAYYVYVDYRDEIYQYPSSRVLYYSSIHLEYSNFYATDNSKDQSFVDNNSYKYLLIYDIHTELRTYLHKYVSRRHSALYAIGGAKLDGQVPCESIKRTIIEIFE